MSPLPFTSLSVLVGAVFLLSFISPIACEYDILTRYTVDRPEGGRHFWLYSPTHYKESPSPSPLPLVLFFHGFTDTCELQGYISQFSVWALVAELYQYHFAVMCGTLSATGAGPGWSSGYPNASRPDDIAYTRAVVARIQQQVKVDTERVFAEGPTSDTRQRASTLAAGESTTSRTDQPALHLLSPSRLSPVCVAV